MGGILSTFYNNRWFGKKESAKEETSDIRETRLKTNVVEGNSLSNSSPFTSTYSRIHRFKEILDSVAGHNKHEYPLRVLEEIEEEWENDSVDSPLSLLDVKRYMKKRGLTMYYEYAPAIYECLSGEEVKKIPKYIKDAMMDAFKSIEEPFEKVKNSICPNRISFLSYNYVGYKLLELLDRKDLISLFLMFRSPKNLLLHDRMWEGICKELNWEFIPTIDAGEIPLLWEELDVL